ncbi:unnamed protein product [Acanthoscelides obtectus]|uniref:COMM domain-containing protein 3 n=1 Tax=Acanthoscelides obtectus TaxID=200917 RepID=A0A9P0P118_ACAOB|nr:unnamed protein product [Acanthoscelides obtectus]CAK1658257.1 hypothetical protein AOBTE_LOCUS20786 [Acanthoscelides obtectus]
MELSEKYADVSKYIPTLNDEAFKKLTQNCISYLTENGEIHNLSSISAAKGDIVKYLYAFLLTITSQFARKRSSSEEIVKHLSHYGIHSARAEWYADQFRKHDKMLTVKTLKLDAVDGPVFMILLVTQKYDLAKEETVTKEIAFRCTVNELQDLVFKIKDAVRHCSVLSKGIL